MIKNFKGILLLFFLLSFFIPCKGESYMPKYELIAHSITAETAEVLSKKHHLSPMGMGGGMMDDIKSMALSLGCYRKLTIDEARILLINCSNEYLEKINNNNDVQPYLHNRPFNSSNIEIRIFMYSPSKDRVSPGDLVTASILKGKLIYRKLGEDGSHKTVLEESFEEAVRIVEGKGEVDGMGR